MNGTEKCWRSLNTGYHRALMFITVTSLINATTGTPVAVFITLMYKSLFGLWPLILNSLSKRMKSNSTICSNNFSCKSPIFCSKLEKMDYCLGFYPIIGL